MPRVCLHLHQAVGDSDYAQYFDGCGTDYALICLECSKEPDAVEAMLRTVSPERFAEIEQAGCWECDEGAIVGRPQVLERTLGLRFRHQEINLAGASLDGLMDIKPVLDSAHGDCLALTDDGEIVRVDLSRCTANRLMKIPDLGVPLSPRLSLHVSPGGEMAAVVETRGRHGVVLDLEGCRPAMRLDRGDYRPENSNFPAAFFMLDGRLRLVHGTDWNRLDISDPRTGELLTDRSPTGYRRGEDRPEHYLDYFHGGLSVSPAGDWVVEDGWVWSPVGIVRAWSLRRWLEDNRWESEDGSTSRCLAYRNYFWDGPLCWIDARTVAVWGYGNDDLNLLPAALLYDVESGERIRWFAGPSGAFVYDRYLFSYTTEAGTPVSAIATPTTGPWLDRASRLGEMGTSVWGVATGERLLHDASFCPMVYHRSAGAFVTILPGGQLRLSRLVDDQGLG